MEAAPSVAAPRAPAVAARRAFAIDLELGGVLDGAPGDGLLSGGGSARLALGARSFYGVLGATALAPTTVTLPVGGARVLRVPFDVGVRGALRRGRIEVFGDLAFSASVLSVEGTGLATPRSEVRFEPGVRAALGARLWIAARIAAFAAFEAVIVPLPHQLTVEQTSVNVALPTVWLAGAIGIAFRVH
jgi:hypothetical protein